MKSELTFFVMGIVVGIAVWSVPSWACPNLSGTYTYEHNGQTETLRLDQSGCEALRAEDSGDFILLPSDSVIDGAKHLSEFRIDSARFEGDTLVEQATLKWIPLSEAGYTPTLLATTVTKIQKSANGDLEISQNIRDVDGRVAGQSSVNARLQPVNEESQ